MAYNGNGNEAQGIEIAKSCVQKIPRMIVKHDIISC